MLILWIKVTAYLGDRSLCNKKLYMPREQQELFKRPQLITALDDESTSITRKGPS